MPSLIKRFTVQILAKKKRHKCTEENSSYKLIYQGKKFCWIFIMFKKQLVLVIAIKQTINSFYKNCIMS